MFKINISNLSDGQHTYDFTATPDEIDIDKGKDDVDLIGDIKVSVNLYKTGNQFSVKTDVKGKFKFECDRCLDDYIYDFGRNFEMIFKYDFSEKNYKVDKEHDDIKFINTNTKFIDLKNDIRDYILLSVPMKRAPEDIDGVCTYCHKNSAEMLNIVRQEEISPVWEKLIKIKKTK